MNFGRGSARRFIAVLLSGALASKLLGFGREMLMAQVLGASLIADGFRGAVAAVLLPLVFLQNESIPAVLIPMHRDAVRDGEGPRRLAALTIVLFMLATALAVAVIGFGEIWIDAIVGGYSPDGRSLTLELTRIMALAMPASVALNVLSSGEIALGRARLTNLRASALNVSVLVGIGVLMVTGDARALAWAFTLGFNGLAIWGVVSLLRQGDLSFAGLTRLDLRRAFAEFFRRLRPLFALPLAEQANTWIERLLTSRITTGAVASLDYARTLTESALLLISQPIGLAVLSGHGARDARGQAEAIARPILALAVPMSAFLLVFAPDIVRLVFFRGAFGDEALALTSQTLRGIAFGLWASTLAWILIRLLNSAGRNAMATVVIVSGFLANVVANLVLSRLHVSSYGAITMIGVGESCRSLVMLTGVVLALDGRWRVFSLIAVSLIPAALMLGIGWVIDQSVFGTLPRLFAGAAAYAACAALAIAMLVPGMRDMALQRIGLMPRPRENCP